MSRKVYKDLYENINLNYNVFVAGDFKSGPEPYTRNSMSEEDKLAWNEFANPLWLKMTQMMESGRNLNDGTIQDYGDKLWEMSIDNPEIAQIALELGMVDMVVSREELRHWMYQEFPNENKVPRPKHWSGWRLKHEEIEFWLEGENRIHERLKYKRNKNYWEKFLLSPYNLQAPIH